MTIPATSADGRRRRLPRGEGQQLRDEILAATERLLIETGSFEAVSIRAVADAVGVTPPSIYRHFADKTALMFDVCARHFTALESYIGERCKGIDDPVDALAALGRAYIEFGIANPEPYRIMFMTRPDIVPVEYQGAVLAESAAFDMLVKCVQKCIDAGRFRPELTDAYGLSLGFWARVHGLTSLMISKPGLTWPDVPDFLDDYTDQCLHGTARDDA
jgi:AcrR family transcriptional regulator